MLNNPEKSSRNDKLADTLNDRATPEKESTYLKE